MLNQSGKEVLIKSVATAILTYVMSCFLLPKKTCNEINCNQRKFWWENNDLKKKINWISWNTLRLSKKDVDLGFRYLHEFNIAFLAKQA